MSLPSHRSFLPFVLCGACSLPLIAFTTPASAADTCDVLYQAAIKTLQTPHHVYTTTTHSTEQMRNSDTFKRGTGRALYQARTESSEAIFDGKVEYLRVHGKWMRGRMSRDDMLELAQEKLKTHPDTCTPAGDQTIGGQAVSVYTARNREAGSQQTVGVFKSTGLLQGGTVTMPDGGVVETRYEYDNARAPAGVP